MPASLGVPVRDAAASLAIAVALTAGAVTRADAVPLFARQTGQTCAACHNGFPELTPYGRLFKLNGYTFGGGQSNIPPISAMTVASFTHTQASQPGGAAPHFGDNNNPAIDFFSMFYGGVLLPHVGMFGQITYDNIGKSFRLGQYRSTFRGTGQYRRQRNHFRRQPSITIPPCRTSGIPRRPGVTRGSPPALRRRRPRRRSSKAAWRSRLWA